MQSNLLAKKGVPLIPKPVMACCVIIKRYCILRGRIKGFNRSITTIMCKDGSYRTVVGYSSYRPLE